MSNSVRYVTFIPEYMESIFKDVTHNETYTSVSELISTIKSKLNTTDYMELYGLNDFLSNSFIKPNNLESIFLKDIKHLLELDHDVTLQEAKKNMDYKYEADKILSILKDDDIANFNIKEYIKVSHLVLPIQNNLIYSSKNSTHDFAIFVVLKKGFTNVLYNANITRSLLRQELLLEELISNIIDQIGENSIKETTLFSTYFSTK